MIPCDDSLSENLSQIKKVTSTDKEELISRSLRVGQQAQYVPFFYVYKYTF